MSLSAQSLWLIPALPLLAAALGALAPRPVFVNAPLRDANFQWSSVDRVLAAAREVYTLYGVPTQLSVAHPNSEHDFPDAQRETAYRLLDAVLR